jgi:predicted  nucleic acid-binding Zn-ribbon protein
MGHAVAARIKELEHLLELEQARRKAIESGLDRLSERCHELQRENALLRERLGDDLPLIESV